MVDGDIGWELRALIGPVVFEVICSRDHSERKQVQMCRSQRNALNCISLLRRTRADKNERKAPDTRLQ